MILCEFLSKFEAKIPAMITRLNYNGPFKTAKGSLTQSAENRRKSVTHSGYAYVTQ